MANNTKKKSSFKKFFEVFKIRMQLLRLWLLKNLSVIIKTALVVILILVMVNVIDGKDFLPLFGMKQSDVESIDWNTFDGIKNVIASLLSAGFSVYVFLRKTKSLAIEDIKSKELKIALIKARLYFNENGKLCKRLEESAQIDLDGDDKIGDTPITQVEDENLVTGIPRAIGELTTILTTKINVDADEDTVVEEAQLDEALPVEEESSIEEKLYSEEVGAPDTEEETKAEGDLTLEEKLDELQVEGLIKENKIEEKKKEKKRRKSFFGEILRALKLSRYRTELDDGYDDALKKKKKPVEKKEEEKVEEVKDTVEVVETPIVVEDTQIVEETTTPEIVEEQPVTPIVEEEITAEETSQVQVEIKTVTITETKNKKETSTKSENQRKIEAMLEEMKKKRK